MSTGDVGLGPMGCEPIGSFCQPRQSFLDKYPIDETMLITYRSCPMDIEFDPEKDTINKAKHGVSLAFGYVVFDDPGVLILPTIRDKDGEERYKALGIVEGRLWTAVHIYRGEVVRFLSVRRSNVNEQRAYDSNSG